ncbi:conserved hypothetical protein [Agrobacterium tumefaciens str. B6]|jgi:hypothetical protein|uniref:Uncharacterized protein n=2 Tax=Agrobacterium tumefaciens TaxID=358 RepID=A0A822V0H7_AGRTU|nr:hypothetical protein ATCR1_24105 [Agrobacterium tumefaciens CCNWGS0286]CUX13333.1 conserved hypothetical protein [Agrobacterium tumefaciens str. CFBP 5621]CUX14623.1 conserved hypothetical protein [Agrobacterium tumefaciens str. Kerr 14]CVI17318.1 conserved hypothetical protein [Agrobacterium tumefaciens str. B6]
MHGTRGTVRAFFSLVTLLMNYNIPTYTKMYINHRGYAD